MDKGSGASPMCRLYNPSLCGISNIELDTLSDRIEQDCFILCDSGEVKAGLQGSVDEVVPNLWDWLKGFHLKCSNLESGGMAFPYTPAPYEESHDHLIIGVFK